MVRLAQYGQAGVGMQVDEPGAYDVPGSVNHARGVLAQIRVVAPVDRHRVARYRHCRAEPGAAGAINHLSVAYQ